MNLVHVTKTDEQDGSAAAGLFSHNANQREGRPTDKLGCMCPCGKCLIQMSY